MLESERRAATHEDEQLVGRIGLLERHVTEMRVCRRTYRTGGLSPGSRPS
jgi:hypothetical protein